ncbi:hypothetical protein EJB05_32313, partial [Eragrostis curvula]
DRSLLLNLAVICIYSRPTLEMNIIRAHELTSATGSLDKDFKLITAIMHPDIANWRFYINNLDFQHA